MAALRQTNRTRVLTADRQRSWQALTEPQTAARWVGGSGTLDLRSEGSRSVLIEPDGTVRHVLVEQVEPTERLVLRWWTDRGLATEPSIVEVVLSDTDGGTAVTVTETALSDHLASVPTG